MGGNSGGATAGSRFRKGSSRMGSVTSTSNWRTARNSDRGPDAQYRYLSIGSVNNPRGEAGRGRMELAETKGYIGGDRLFVTQTFPLPEQDMSKGIGMGMYLTALKYAQDNNLAFHSGGSVSAEARVVWNSLAARGVGMTKNESRSRGPTESSAVFQISREEVQGVDIASLNRRRKTTG